MEEVSQSETSLTGSVEDEKLPIEEVENQRAEEETTPKKSEESPVVEEEVDNIIEETKDDNVAEEDKSPAAVCSEQKDERGEADVVEEDDVIQEADEVEEADVVEEIKETEKDDEASQEQPNEEEPNPKTPDQREQPTAETVDREVSPPLEESNNTQDEAEVEEKEAEKDDLHVSKADDEEKSGDAEDHDATTFEEVDANVSAEKSADESDMLGESDMTCPEKEAEKRGADNPVTPMEVDSLSNDDVEMVSGDGESEEKDKEDQVDEDPDHDKESLSQSASKSPVKDAAEEDERMDDDIEENPETASTIPRGEDVVDDGKDDKEPDESIAISEHAADDEDDDVHEEAEKTSTNKEGHAEEDEEEEANKEAVEKDGEDEMQDDNDVEMIEDDNNSNESPATREDDADPEGSHVENVQEPEESDVCLIPDTETEVTDAEKEKAIQARENAEKENEAAEAAAEAEAAALAKEGEEGASSAENQAETAQEGTPQEQEQEHEQEQEPLLEEMQPPGPVEGGTVQKIIIFHAVSQEKTCAHCKEEKTCGFRYKDAELGKTQYICKTGCIDTLMTGNPGRYFIRRKKFLVEEVPESAADSNQAEHDCLQCKKTVSKNKYFFKQEDETFYICSEDCYKVLSSEEPEKFNLKRDSIRVRNIGHTTISSSKGSSSDSRLVSRSSQEAEAAKVERTKSFQRICTECKTDVQIRINGKNLIWQTMDFCDEQCLGKYQRRIGSHCQTCKGEVPHQSLGKYCVRFGFEVRQFCCAACLNNFKKGLKTCSCCQKDISVSGEGFLAPVGDKEQFKDFCSQACMRRYDSMVNAKKKLRTDRCGVCNFEKLMRVEMTIDGNEHNFCSNPCFSAFKFVSNIVPDQCGMCSKYFERKSNDCFTIYGDKQRPKVFCSRICFNVYIIVNRQITSCQWCKVKKYDFDMIMKLVDSQNPLMMCSLNCLTLYGVSINAFSRAAVKCDNCSSCTTPQYHLTMSDGTMRNFCTYQCVMQFQSQFARVPLTLDSEAVATATHHVTPKVKTPASSAAGAAPFPTGLPKRVKLNAAQAKAAAATSPQKSQQPVMPVISNVASLASGQSERVTNSSSGIRRGASRGRGRARKMTLERPVPPPSPPPSPTSAPSTRGRSSGSPAPAPPSALASGVKSTRGGRTSSRSTGTHTPTETTRSPSPIIQKEIETKIVTVPPYPPLVRNVQTSCCPKTEDVGINCRPRTAEIGIQTDEDYSTRVLIPVPVPIFVPQPMYMYSAPFPMPIPIPLPIPVPIFIPTTRNSSAGILKEIKKIQDKMPADPFEAELLMMAEMVADEKNESDSDSEEEMKPEPRMIEVEYQTPGQTTNNVVNMEAQNNSSFGEDVLQMALKMASGEYEEPGVDLESAMTANTITNPPPGMIHSAHVQEDSGMQIGHHMMMEQPQRGGRGRKRGAIASPVTPRNNRSPIKRQRLSVDNTPPQPPQPVLPVEKPDANMCLKFTFGVNAWKQWVMTKNADIEKSSIRRRLFKTELLQMTADELNYSLCLFVKEVRKPNGTEYAPDTIYYLVLGIQQYLYENGRIDNIFTDPYYERFTDCLDEVARKFSVLYNDSQYIVTRVEEEHLWECKQLGAHSPHVLLSTLMFFNTKHFNLTNVEEHMQLSFSHIMKHWKRSAQNTKSPGTRNVLLRFYPPQAGLDANPRKKKVYEQQENDENPLRCPVRLYEFYLSKCPESVKTRNDVFYLQPERSCVPDSPVWYSTQALSEDHLQKMLHRVKMVKEINIALLTS